MSALTDLLLQGPRSATELRLSLAISQATFSRLVAAQDGVVQFGKARATRYALLKPVRGVASFPLWRVDSQGTSSQFGVIYPCWPQGFLGRAWGGAIAADINLPNDIRFMARKRRAICALRLAWRKCRRMDSRQGELSALGYLSGTHSAYAVQ